MTNWRAAWPHPLTFRALGTLAPVPELATVDELAPEYHTTLGAIRVLSAFKNQVDGAAWVRAELEHEKVLRTERLRNWSTSRHCAQSD